jgi:hypothetical protein
MTVFYCINKLIPWSRVILEKLIVAQLVKKLSAFYGTEGALPCSQMSATGPHPEPVDSCLNPLNLIFKIHFNIIFPFEPDLPSGLLKFSE